MKQIPIFLVCLLPHKRYLSHEDVLCCHGEARKVGSAATINAASVGRWSITAGNRKGVDVSCLKRDI